MLDGSEGGLIIKGDIEFDSQTCKPNGAFIIIQDINDKKQAELTKKANEKNVQAAEETLEMDRFEN
jgi:hypothetical protein